MNYKIAARIITVIAVLFTFLPYTDIQSWHVRMMDFPHLQITITTALMLAAFLIIFDVKNIFDYILVGLLVVSLYLQCSKIYPYTAWAPKEVFQSGVQIDDSLKVYSVNVLQSNEKHRSLIAQIENYNPDVLLFLETDVNWQNTLNEHVDGYPFKVEFPLDNTYGMILYSKFELINPQVKLMVEDSIPSIHTLVKLPKGDIIQLYAVHPTPPVPMHNPDAYDRDAELMHIALLANESPYPVVVLGDFNDVAWSSSTQLFQKASGLLDIRKGRGMFHTFKAEHLIFKWPLDHIFISPHFRLKNMEVCPTMGSDHLPLFVSLTLEKDKVSQQQKPPPSKEILDQARLKIENEIEDDAKKEAAAAVL